MLKCLASASYLPIWQTHLRHAGRSGEARACPWRNMQRNANLVAENLSQVMPASTTLSVVAQRWSKIERRDDYMSCYYMSCQRLSPAHFVFNEGTVVGCHTSSRSHADCCVFPSHGYFHATFESATSKGNDELSPTTAHTTLFEIQQVGTNLWNESQHPL